jgi:plasmid stabilization system protein ParE
MRRYIVKISSNALKDIENTHDFIAYQLFEPITADKYIRGIFETIDHLAIYGASIAPSLRDSLITIYDNTVRSVIFKKMTIIYTVSDGTINIRRIMPGVSIL